MRAASSWVMRHLDGIAAGGGVLDVAAGGGRHVRLCRAAGLAVTAVDRDVDALRAFSGDPGVEVVRADLERDAWPLAGRRFDGVIVTNYLWRPVLPSIIAALAPGGLLIYETFATGNEAYGRPRNPEFLLRPNELLEAALPGLEVVEYRHGLEPGPQPAVRQKIAARRPAMDRR